MASSAAPLFEMNRFLAAGGAALSRQHQPDCGVSGAASPCPGHPLFRRPSRPYPLAKSNQISVASGAAGPHPNQAVFGCQQRPTPSSSSTSFWWAAAPPLWTKSNAFSGSQFRHTSSLQMQHFQPANALENPITSGAPFLPYNGVAPTNFPFAAPSPPPHTNRYQFRHTPRTQGLTQKQCSGSGRGCSGPTFS